MTSYTIRGFYAKPAAAGYVSSKRVNSQSKFHSEGGGRTYSEKQRKISMDFRPKTWCFQSKIHMPGV
jgi:hypothetical protein